MDMDMGMGMGMGTAMGMNQDITQMTTMTNLYTYDFGKQLKPNGAQKRKNNWTNIDLSKGFW